MFLNYKRSLFLSLFAILFSTTLFAANEEGLLIAIQKNSIEDVKISLKNGENPQEIKKFTTIPSLEISELLLENGIKSLGPNTFIGLILPLFPTNTSIAQRDELIKLALNKGADPTLLLQMAITQISIINSNPETIIMQEKLISMALEKGAKFSNIKLDYIIQLPSLAAADMMLDNKIDPNMFLELVLAAYCNNEELTKQQLDLVKKALANNADANRLLEIATTQSIMSENIRERRLHLYPFNQKELIELALKSGAKFSAINVDGAYIPPSPSAVEIMLNNSYGSTMDPDIFLDLIMRTFFDKKESQQKEFLLNLAIKKGADPQKINYFGTLPSLELSQTFLSKKLNSTNFLDLVLSCKDLTFDSEFISNQNELIDFAIEKNGADLEQINYPEAADAIRKKEAFVGRNQYLLEQRLAAALQKYLIIPNNDINELAEKFAKQGGFFLGLTTLWLHSKWLQFTSSEKDASYYNSWFKDTTRDITTWDSGKILSNAKVTNFINFAKQIDLLETSKPFLKSNINNTQSIIDLHGKKLEIKYTIASIFTLEQLCLLLKEIIHDDEWIYVLYYNHTIGLFKHGNDYYLYNPNANAGEYKNTSIEKIAATILTINNKQGAQTGRYDIGFIVVGDPENKIFTYPKQKEFLANNILVTNKNFQTLSLAAFRIRCLECLEFLLNQKEINLTQQNVGTTLLYTFLMTLITNSNNTDEHLAMLTLLLKRKDVDTNLFAPYSPTSLNLAVMNGNMAIVQTLLASNRVNINLADKYDGRTPLISAVAAGHVDIAILLLNSGANPNIQDRDGKTALIYAAQTGNLQLAKLLRTKEADLSFKDKNGKTALDLFLEKKTANTALEKLLRGEVSTSHDEL